MVLRSTTAATRAAGCSPDDSVFSTTQSNHPGGVNVLMADGSGRFIKNSISPADLDGPGYAGPWRSHQLRLVLKSSVVPRSASERRVKSSDR